jgi:DNA repair protein RecO (recombination protein O)
MSDLITVQGVVLSAQPVGEYDRRIVLLTRERGKISAFAKGARRQNSPFMAVTAPFVFGAFSLYEGRTSYNLNHVAVQHQFVELSAVQPGIYYGYYFLELADYFGREGTDEREMMNLLYVTVNAILNPAIDDRLVRCIFELRTMAVQGLCPQLDSCVSCGGELTENEIWISQEEHGVLCTSCCRHVRDARRISAAALYAMQYIVSVPMGKLYTFRVTEEVLAELEAYIHLYTARNTEHRFKTLDILNVMSR